MSDQYAVTYALGDPTPGRRKSRWDATAAPGASDDETKGYAVGSVWLDTTGPDFYRCADASEGAAVWTAGGGGGSDDQTAAEVPYDNDDSGLAAEDVQAAIDELAAYPPGSLPWYVVTAYGATGDGSTDDTTSIQAAINAAQGAGGGTVYFPSGTYRITAALTISTAAISLLGDGGAASWNSSHTAGSSIIKQVTANTNGVTLTHPAGPCMIRHLAFEGPTGNSSGAAIYANSGGSDDFLDVDCIDVYTLGFFNGLRLGDRTYFSKFYHCRFKGADGAAVLLAAGGNNADFFGCRIEHSAIGVDFGGHLGCSIVGGSIELNSTAGIRANGGSGNGAGLHVAGVYFEQVDGVPDILLGNSAQMLAVTVEGCAFIKSDHSGSGWHIDGQDVDGLTVIGNEFESSQCVRAVGSSDHVVLINNRNRNSGTITVPAGSVILDTDAAVSPADVGTTAAGTSLYYARADHVHGGSTGGGPLTPGDVRDAGRWEVVVDGSGPPVPLTNEAEDDWLYGWITG